jgi:cytochrome c5
MNLRIASIVLLLSSISVVAAAAKSSANAANSAQPAPAAQQAAPGDRLATVDAGERVFKTNCARCHNPPMSLSPRIAGSVVMHMRVRARLSRRDEDLLLKYLAP